MELEGDRWRVSWGEGIRDPGKLMFPDLQECFHLTTSCLTLDTTWERSESWRIWGHLGQEPGHSGYREPGAPGSTGRFGLVLTSWGSGPGPGPRQVRGRLPFLREEQRRGGRRLGLSHEGARLGP